MDAAGFQLPHSLPVRLSSDILPREKLNMLYLHSALLAHLTQKYTLNLNILSFNSSCALIHATVRQQILYSQERCPYYPHQSKHDL